jgi:hypothetical protein
MNIVVLSSLYLNNNASANGICARRVTEALSDEGHSVYVICYEDGELDVNEEKVITITPKRKTENTNITWKVRVKSYSQTLHALITPVVDRKLVENYLKAMDSLKHGFDMIIAMFYPYETVVAAKRYKEKHPNVILVSYELDSAGDGVSNGSFLDRIKAYSYERSMERSYRFFDKIVIMSNHRNFWDMCHSKHERKRRVVDIPMLTDKTEVSKSNKQNETYSAIYSGLLDIKYRNPQFLLNLLDLLNEEKNELILHFYSKGNCQDQIDEKSTKSEYIYSHGYVNKAVLEEAIMGADFLINIGNINSNSLPSKLVDYISYGKPIIHLSSQDRDPCIGFLKHYSLALILKETDGINACLEALKHFIDNYDGKHIDYSVLSKSYPMNTPKYSVRAIVDGVE